MQSTYNAPDIILVGSVESLTGATGSGRKLDKTFEAGTDFDDLTFS